ncbi:dynein assembly factor 5, axonemal-like [Asterias rubens]|uniref:dynein assembly factor 5, axonemal-like n=1 Tax=Asterias rubens TaxID=7604 RepID=UPI001454EB92|nr:dynein assembly factor 5, axonemal-like [Asterias rubens]
MADNVESKKSEVAGILQAIARHINCLSENNRITKKKALESIRKETLGKKPAVDPEILQGVFESVVKPLLKCFADNVERCRELAIDIVSDFVDVVPCPEACLPYLMPTVVQRLGNQEIVESSEELRLSLVCLLVKITNITKKKLGPYLDDLVNVLQRTIVDPFPDVRRESCKCTCLIARFIPEHFHMQSESLIKPLSICISHQHAKVRTQCILTIGDVLQFGSHKPMDQVISHLAQRLFDQSPQVRMAVTDVVGGWLLDFVDRYSFHHKLIPLLLSSQTDELPDIQNKAFKLWDEIGAKYAQENEEELKDQLDFGKMVDLPLGETTRPNLGCRTLMFRNLSKILPGLLNDLTDWTTSNRIMSAKLLRMLLLNSEDHTTQHMEKLLSGMYRACGDEEREVVQQILLSAEIVGFFVDPEIYWKLVNPTVRSAQSPGVLMTLAGLIRGSKPETLQPQLMSVCQALVDPEVCRNEQTSYQVELLSCIQAILATSKEQCSEVSLQLFTTLVTLLALARDDDLKTRIREGITSLAKIQGMEDNSALYRAHTRQVLDSLKGNYEQWTNFSVERPIFDALLTESGVLVSELLTDIIPVIRVNLHPDKDPELRLKFFSLLSRLVMKAGESEGARLKFGDFSLVVVKEMIVPNCVWHGGRTATAIRTTAISCLWALLQSGLLTAEQVSSVIGELQTQLTSLLEDGSRSTRLITCRVIQRILALCGSTFDPDRLHTMYMELLKRMDDSSNEIRIAVAKTFETFFKCFPEDYDKGLYKAHLETLYRGLLIHLDDPDSNIQQAVLDVLKQAAPLHPHLLLEEVEMVRHKHRSFLFCDELIQHVKTLTG